MDLCYKTFISVGNGKQLFSRLLNEIESLADVLPKPILIQSGHTPLELKIASVVDFIAMDAFTKYINDAEILILHAGAGSILHAIKAKKYPIVVPRKAQFNEIVNDHQVSFAKILDAEGKVLLVENPKDLRSAIKKVQEKNSFVTADYKSRAGDVINNLLVELFNQPKTKYHEDVG